MLVNNKITPKRNHIIFIHNHAIFPLKIVVDKKIMAKMELYFNISIYLPHLKAI